jgi:hypothetical protein
VLCSNKKCRRPTDRAVYKADKDGKIIEGCPACIFRGKHEHVYTGRKFWTGDEVYGREKCKEKNHEWGERLVARGNDPRRFVPKRRG